jgi:NitT/TauT family transport system substrate-binding protein
MGDKMTRRAVRSLLRAAALSVMVAGGVKAQPKEVIFASGDPSDSVATAPYTSLQQAAGLTMRYAGVSVKVQPTAGATAAAQAVSAGNAFYSWGGTTSQIPAVLQDPSLVIVAFDAGNAYRIVVPADSPIHSIAELKGKVIGTQSLGSAAYLYGRAAVNDAGIDAQRDVRWLPIGVGAQAASALQSGAAAAYAGYDNPDAIIGILLGKPMRELPSPLDHLAGMTGIIVTRDTLAKYPKIVAGLCKSLYTSFLFAQANPQATVLNHWRTYPEQKPSNKPEAEALSDALGILRARLAIATVPGPEGLFGWQPLSALQNTADTLLKVGLLTRHADMATVASEPFKEDCGKLDAAAIAAEGKAWKVPGQ